MQVPAVVNLATLYFSLPQDSTTNLLMALRWVHFVAGITWVGLLYFFNLVSTPMFRDFDAPLRAKVLPALMSRAMWWFRWASVATVLAGIWYWMVIVGSDRRNAPGLGFPDASGGAAIGSFFGLWTVAFILYMGVLMMTQKSPNAGGIVGVAAAIVVVVAAALYVRINSHGWESNRLIAIGIGGGLGWFMMFNVWGVIWRVQKKLIRWNTDAAAHGTPIPEEAVKLARLNLRASRTNFWLSFPMLFFMGAASHYPLFTGR
jgi:uncharacterized membrane protein